VYKQVTHCAQTADVTGMQLLTSHQSAVDDVVPYAPTNTHTRINIHNPTTYCHSHMHVVIKTCIHTHTPCNVACGCGVTSFKSPGGSTLQCHTIFWD